MKRVVKFIRSLKPLTIGAMIFLIIEIIFFTQFKIIIGSGMSMYPTIKDKSVLICEYTDDYKVNDIVYYRLNNKPIVHRIIQITEYLMQDNTVIKVYKIKGDNNSEADAFEVYRENIVCKVKGFS